jgi:hypothetical protein
MTANKVWRKNTKGYQSIADLSLVLVRFRSGKETTTPQKAMNFEWEICDQSDDIMEYAVTGKGEHS